MSERSTIVLLHGFAGTRRGWDPVMAALDRERYRPLALDLPGHGEAGPVRPITFESVTAHVLSRCPPRFGLVGYSMGGRLALQVALAAPERVSRLVLIATTAGLDDDLEREVRRRADAALADDLQRGPYESFIERWRSQPLFADEPPRVARAARADQRRNDPQHLAVALRALGTGAMEPLWGRLGELRMPVTVVVGERDRKFSDVGRRMAAALPRAELRSIAGGHSLALWNPTGVAAVLDEH